MVRDTIGYTIYSSSGVLIKEEEQKTIAGSLLSESQTLECRFFKKNHEDWNGWALEKGGGWNQKETEIFHYVNEEKRELKHKCIFEVGIW